jgi:4-diphosphocytidyl-2-C-methyl-D-erythritol kinase
MHTVSLCDDIAITEQSDDAQRAVSFYSNAHFLPRDERNLAVRAALLFAEQTGYRVPVRIDMRKSIPVSAGLAGGSSDAAAVLRGLNIAFGSPLSVEKLCAIGASIGSDVPFCIVGGTRLCHGKGEKMSIYPMDDKIFVIVPPVAEKMETPKAYRMLDEAFQNYENENPALHEALFGFFAEDATLGMYNVFESVVLPLSPETDELRAELDRLGARAAMMSGSGTAVFGIFETEEEANAAARELPGAVVCKSIGALL